MKNRKSTISKRSFIAGTVAIIGLMIVAGTILHVSAVKAKIVSSAGNEGGGGRPGCYVWQVNNGKTPQYATFFDTCFGGVWREYTATDDTIVIPDAGSVKGGTIRNCKTQGGKYYRLALVRFNTNWSLDASKFTSTGTQVALWPGTDFEKGDVTYRPNDGLEWEKVREKFEIAKQHGADMDGHEWPDVSWFCFDDKWEVNAGGYWSTSTVETPAQPNTTATQPNPDKSNIDSITQQMEVTTTEDKVDINFWHTLYHDESLSAPDILSKYPPITKEELCTVWHKETYIRASNGDKQYLSGVDPTNGTFCQQDHRGEGATGTKVSSGTVTVDVPKNQTVTVCSTIYYKPKYIEIIPNWSGGYRALRDMREVEDEDGTRYEPMLADDQYWSSTACARIYHSTETREASFWSDSEVYINAQNDVDSHNLVSQLSKDQNGSRAKISLSTDYDQLEVGFKHRIYYDDLLWKWSLYSGTAGHPVSSSDIFPDVKTQWTVTTTIVYEDGVEESELSGEFHTYSSGDNSGTIAYDYTVPIDLTRQTPGNPVIVTSRITFEPAYVTMVRNGHGCSNGDSCWWDKNDNYHIEHKYYKYSAIVQGGQGSTSASNEVRNPIVSRGNMSNGADIMYTGESQGPVGWNTEGTSQGVRRLTAYQGASYVVSSGQTYAQDIVRGNIGPLAEIRDHRYPAGSSSPVCSYFSSGHYIVGGVYNNGLSIVSCDTFSTNSGAIKGDTGYGEEDDTHTTAVSSPVVTPDLVGAKYCNSYGYKYEYWFNYTVDELQGSYQGQGVNKEQKELGWHHDPIRDYWEIYDSTCRTVVKKPSAALWNGSFMTNGGIETTEAVRYDNADNLFNVSAGNQAQTSFGSWSEYLAVIKNSAYHLASGAAFAEGASGVVNFMNPAVSPLTIANANGLGNSGVTNNSSYRIRLKTYFEDQCNGVSSPSWGSCRGKDWLDTTTTTSGINIVVINDNYELNHNIEISPVASGPYKNLYEIPRNIIFIHGSLKITSNVRQIDAWLIVDGGINTCSDFGYGTMWANGACSKQLIFNGPVYAGSMTLLRSYGADPYELNVTTDPSNGRATAGEIFNFRADDYLWAYAQAGRYASSYTESYSRELAPRY